MSACDWCEGTDDVREAQTRAIRYRRSTASQLTTARYGRVPASYRVFVDGVERGEIRGEASGYSGGKFWVYVDGVRVTRFAVPLLREAKRVFESALSGNSGE